MYNSNNENSDLLLALDLATGKPSFSVFYLSRSSAGLTQDNFHEFELSSLSSRKNSENNRYELSNLVNYLSEAFNELKISPKDINTFCYCSGPGAFSPIRVASVIAKLIHSFSDKKNIFSFDVFSLFYETKKHELKNKEGLLFLKSGLSGYITCTFSKEGKIHEDNMRFEREILLKDSQKDRQKENKKREIIEVDFSLSRISICKLMTEIVLSKTEVSERHRKTKSEEIAPNYIRPPSITQRRS